MTLDAIPDSVREQLPAKLTNAEMVGSDVAGADDNVLLHGPPGTGKSTQIALRLATLLSQTDITAEQMTVVTYRRDLADTIESRLREWGVLEGGEVLNDWGTIHAIAADAADFWDRFEDDDEGGMVDKDAKWEFCQQFDIGAPTGKFEVFHDAYSYARNNLLDVGAWSKPHDRRDRRSDARMVQHLEEFANVWGSGVEFDDVVKAFENWKQENNYYDFCCQLEAALVCGLPPLTVLAADEYHDTTPLMAAVLERWIDHSQTAIVAGDPQQVINSYTGASPAMFTGLADRVDAELPTVTIGTSHRVPAEHYAAARRMLEEHVSAPQVTTTGRGTIARHSHMAMSHDRTTDTWHLPSPDEPGSPVDLVQNHAPDLMFLARTQAQLDGVAACLDHSGLIYDAQDTVGGDWTTRLELMEALERLEAVEPARGAGSTPYPADEVTNAREVRIASDVVQTLVEHTHGRYLDDGAEWFAASTEDAILTADELDPFVTPAFWSSVTRGRESLGELTGLDATDHAAMQAAWDRLDGVIGVGVERDGVTLKTIHAAKGAEAEDVIVYDGVTKRVSESLDTQTARENEARTWYVALTRAGQRLHIVRDGHTWTQQWLPDDLERRAAARVAAVTDGGRE